MKNIKRILVGIDVFDKSNLVLKRAFMLAEEHNASIYLVHAVQVPWLSLPSYFASDALDIDSKGIEKRFNKKIRISKVSTKVKYSIFIKEGPAEDVMLHEAKLLKADMIIIGAHSKSKGIKKLLGTTAQKIADKCHIPLLIVKKSVRERYQHALVPTDFNESSNQSVRYLRKLSPSSKISAVHSTETIYLGGPYTAGGIDFVEYNDITKKYAKKDLKDFMKKHAITEGKIIDGGFNNKEALITYIKKGNYDLVAIGAKATFGLNVLLGSVASMLLKDSPTDILVYNS